MFERFTKNTKIATNLLFLYIFVSTFFVLFFSSSTFALFSQMPTNLAGDGREDGGNSVIVHMSRVGNDSDGNGGLLQSTTIKVYHQGNDIPVGDEAKIFVDRIQGSCDLVANINSASANPYKRTNPSETCNIMKYQIPSESAVWKTLTTTEGTFRVATVTFNFLDAGDPNHEDSIQNPNNPGFRKTIDINHFSSFNGTRLGFAGSRAVSIDVADTGGSPTRNYSLAFGVPCNASPTDTVNWLDDDQGENPQHGHDLSMQMVNAVTGNVVGSNPNWGGKLPGSMAVTLKANNSYNWNWGNVYKGNAIKIYYPYDSAWYYLSCQPKSWELGAYSYIKSGPYNVGESYGSLSRPEDGPSPGEHFQFINDIRNNGERAVSDGYWTCLDNSDYPVADTDPSTPGHQTAGWSGGANNSCKPNPDGRAWWLKDNTQNIVFDRGRTGYADDTFACIGAGTAQDDLLYNNPNGGWNWWDNNAARGVGCGAAPGPHDGNGGQDLVLQTGDGGKQICQNGSYYPRYAIEKKESTIDSTKTTGWTLPHDQGEDDRGYTSLCLYIPYHYKLSSEMTTHPVSMTQQGDAVMVVGKVTNPLTTDGKNNTDSHNTLTKGIVEFQLPSGAAEPAIGADAGNGLAPCAWVANKVPAAQACDANKASRNDAVVAGGPVLDLSYTRPALDTIHLGVGTKLCYAIYVQHPQHLTSADNDTSGPYSYTSIDCTVIVKSPKVQFENGDLTVGRHWIDGKTHANGSACDDIVGTASITASGAPDVVRDDTTGTYSPKELYGSWVEYGAFARGSISGMGTGSRPFGLGVDTVNGAKRLMFSNTITGGFNYGVTCLNNPFENIKTNDSTQVTNLASLPAIPSKPPVYEDGNLRINELAELYDKSYDKTGYVSKAKDIKITPRPKDSYSVRVKINASGQSGNDVPNGPMSTPKMRVSVGDDSGVYSDKTIDVTSVYPAKAEYQETFNLGDAGYKGPQDVSGSNPVIDIDFVNNNDNDAWQADSSQMTDRNLYLGDITVEWLKNGNPIHTSGPFAPASLTKDSHDYYTGNPSAPCPTQTANGLGLFPILSSTGDNGYQLGYCHGVHIYQNQLGITPEPTPPSILSDDYPNFGGDGTHEGRDIVLYAQLKDPTKSCSDPVNDGSGNLFIDQDIVYKRYGYNKLTELPRVVFVADCDITIASDVTKVYASLIAGDAIKTCSVKALTVADCNKALYISGAISANRLLLWRTYGADLTSAGAAQTPAEDFSMSPSQMVTGYTRGNGTPNPTVAHEVDLPPRY